MANFQAIYSVGQSVATYLRNALPQSWREDNNADVRLISSSELATDTPDFGVAITLFLYRMNVSEHLRNARPVQRDHSPPLTLELHYMLSAWADKPMLEQALLGWALHQLHHRPILDRSNLDPIGGWSDNEVIHLVPSDITTEDMMRVWDAVTASYRLSFSYTARVVQIEAEDVVREYRPIVATRFEHSDKPRL